MRLCAVGDNVVDRYIDLGVMYPGGNAVNVAVHARRCGAQAAYLGALGEDAAGRLLSHALQTEDVDTSRVRVLSGPNAYATVRLRDGDRVFGDAAVGVSMFELSAADVDYLKSFDLVHTGDCSGLESQLELMSTATRISYDFSDRPLTYAEPLLPHVDIATFSASGASVAEAEELVRWAHGQGARNVVVTRGAAGAYVSDGSRLHRQTSSSAEIVDTLGAGDAFIARYLVALLQGMPIDAAAAAAADYAAEVCGVYGAFGYQTADDSSAIPNASSSSAVVQPRD